MKVTTWEDPVSRDFTPLVYVVRLDERQIATGQDEVVQVVHLAISPQESVFIELVSRKIALCRRTAYDVAAVIVCPCDAARIGPKCPKI
jgi:hypothetical protein